MQDISLSTDVHPPACRLAAEVRVTVRVDGPAPVRVALADPPVDPASARVWQVRPAGPPATTDRPAGRQRWEQVLVADPLRPGDPLPLRLAPARAAVGPEGREVDVGFPEVRVRVTTAVADPAAEVRPPTGPEHPPAAPATDHGPAAGWAAVAVAVAVAAVCRRVFGRFTRRRTPADPAAELAAAERHLTAGGDPAEVVGRVAAVVRRWAGDRPGAAELLRVCDAVRFSGRPVKPGAAFAVLEGSRRLMAEASIMSEAESAHD